VTAETARPTSYRPLAGLRVLDLTRLMAGNLATRQLADLGAEVVKVEHPLTGDYQRGIPPLVDGYALWHELLNRNKKSVALDITDPADRDTILQLIAVADVVVEVSRPGSLKRLGIDLAACRERRPELVVCSISGFGQTGPWSQLPAHGGNMDGLAGMTVTREGSEGIRFVQLAYTSLGNELGAINAALAVTAAAFGARSMGIGAWIDISCWDCLIDTNRAAIAYLAATGDDVQITESHIWGSKHGIYRTSDQRLVFIALIELKFWQQFCDAIDRSDLREQWDGTASVDYGSPALRDEMVSIIASKTADEWQELFVSLSLPGSPLLTLAEVVEEPHFAARGLVEPREGKRIPNVPGPIRWMDHPSERPGAHPSAAPELGSDTAEVLKSWLGTD
jgi:alpha-methylacyl-CoA racemase